MEYFLAFVVIVGLVVFFFEVDALKNRCNFPRGSKKRLTKKEIADLECKNKGKL